MQWYVVQTQSNGEQKAAFHLRRQGFTVYLPRYLKRWRHARRTEMRAAPLFPRYLFVAMDIAETRWRTIRSTVGVTSLVCSGDRPAPVPAGIVEDIRAREIDGGLVPVQMACPFKRGDIVTVVAGGLSGASGFFECFRDRDRVVLLLELLGRSVCVDVPVDSVAAAT